MGENMGNGSGSFILWSIDMKFGMEVRLIHTSRRFFVYLVPWPRKEIKVRIAVVECCINVEKRFNSFTKKKEEASNIPFLCTTDDSIQGNNNIMNVTSV